MNRRWPRAATPPSTPRSAAWKAKPNGRTGSPTTRAGQAERMAETDELSTAHDPARTCDGDRSTNVERAHHHGAPPERGADHAGRPSRAEYNVSRERIRQIEVRAFEKLQKAMREAAREQGLARSQRGTSPARSKSGPVHFPGPYLVKHGPTETRDVFPEPPAMASWRHPRCPPPDRGGWSPRNGGGPSFSGRPIKVA